MIFKIEKVLERDIDLLVINNFINGKLLMLFLDKIGISDYNFYSVEHSYMDTELGESDITVIIEKDNHKIGLLIEDKIDAPVMKLQPERYFERGKKGIDSYIYDEFKTIIIAPQQYLSSNSYVYKYQYQISYEELIDYLSDDLYSTTLLNKAIEEKESGYIIIENKMVTAFWGKYYEFIKLYYPNIKIKEIFGPRGSRAVWPEMSTNYKQVIIIHKSNKGYVDLTFRQMASHTDIFDKYVKNILPEVKMVNTGKSLAIRLNVPIIHFNQNFENYIPQMHECMKSVLKLYEILSKINVLMMYNEIEKNNT